MEYPETYKEAVAAIRKCRSSRRLVVSRTVRVILYTLFRMALVAVAFCLLFLLIDFLSGKNTAWAGIRVYLQVWLVLAIISVIGHCVIARIDTRRIRTGTYFNGMTDAKVLAIARSYVDSYNALETKQARRRAKRHAGEGSRDP